ncbi:MAG: hypothetical protein ACRD3C_03340 [Vicinamibacterales bacterium]
MGTRRYLFPFTLVVATAWPGQALAQLTADRYAEGQPKSVAGCPAEPLTFHRCALDRAKTFAPPRTPSGRPDMQGYWFGLLVSEYSVESVDATDPRAQSGVEPWEVWPGMVVDPPDRKIPYQPWAATIGRAGENRQLYIDPRTACQTAGVPRLAQQGDITAKRDPHQLIQPQGDNHVVWLFEDSHVYRVIGMGGRPHVGQEIKLWHGDSRGRWEGNTLVVDTRNLNGYTWLDDAGNFYTDAAHLVERLTMIDRDAILYEVTIDDPTVYTRPWTMAWALVRETEPGFQLLEEACVEGDRDLPHFLEAGLKFYFGKSWKSRPRGRDRQ